MQPNKTKIAKENMDVVWRSMRKLRNFTVSELAKDSGQLNSVVLDLVKRLILSGHVKEQTLKPFSFELVKDCGAQRPNITRKGKAVGSTIYQKMWISMKILKSFTARDLSLAAEVNHMAAKAYITLLVGHGYLKYSGTGRTNSQGGTYFFIPVKDTGPIAPSRVDGKLYDNNLKKFVGDAAKREVA